MRRGKTRTLGCLARFAKDLRADTATIGLLNALAWYLAYPVFIGFLGSARSLGGLVELGFPVIMAFGLAGMVVMLLLSLVPVVFAGVVTYTVAFIVRYAYRYRLQDTSWRTVANLGAAYSVISLATFAMGLSLFPPNLSEQEQQVHNWLWPYGLTLLTVVLSIVSAATTWRLLAPRNGDRQEHAT
jgi:hypothetical protein